MNTVYSLSSTPFLASYLFGSADPDTLIFPFLLTSSKPEGENGKTLTYILDIEGSMHIHFTLLELCAGVLTFLKLLIKWNFGS